MMGTSINATTMNDDWSEDDDKDDAPLLSADDEINQPTKGFLSSFKAGIAARKLKILITCTYVSTMIGLGLVMSAIGPTLEGLAQAFGQEHSTDLAPILMSRGVGYTIGTLVMGWTSTKYKHKRHLGIVVSAVVMGVFAMLIPQFASGKKSLWTLVLMMTFMSLAGGALDLGTNVLLTIVWQEDRFAAPAMNMLHFAWGVGSMLSPLVADGVGLEADRMRETWAVTGAIAIFLGVPPIMFASPLRFEEIEEQTKSENEKEDQDSESVDKLEAQNKSAKENEDEEGESGDELEAELQSQNNSASANDISPLKFYVGITALFFFYFAYAGCEHTPGDWLATFAMDQLDQDEDVGAYMTSVYWAMLTFGRLLGVGTSVWLSANQLIGLDFGMCIIGCILLITLGGKDVQVAYFSSGLIGFGLSTLYPMGILLGESRLPLTAKWISRFIAGGTIGSVVVPVIVGLLFKISSMAFSWALLSFIGMQFTCYMTVALMKPLKK
eukprot:m.34740 g.34740  ORF g.34740 m.34740 type:complete len:496 (-) comp8771_c0_seq2:22-1509(-)